GAEGPAVVIENFLAPAVEEEVGLDDVGLNGAHDFVLLSVMVLIDDSTTLSIGEPANRQAPAEFFRFCKSARQLGQPPLEEPPLRREARQRERPLVGGPGLGGPAQPPAQVGPRRMRE